MHEFEYACGKTEREREIGKQMIVPTQHRIRLPQTHRL